MDIRNHQAYSTVPSLAMESCDHSSMLSIMATGAAAGSDNHAFSCWNRLHIDIFDRTETDFILNFQIFVIRKTTSTTHPSLYP
jgi:hypothetical protein